jgi:glycosyltransferase involved in cell wall biosynthesis
MTQKPRHLCLVAPADFMGGAELFVKDLALFVAEREDFQLTVITSQNDILEKILPRSSRILKMDFPRLKEVSLNALKNFSSTSKALEKKIAEVDADLILSNTIRGHILCAKIKKSMGKPLAFMVHDFTFPKLAFAWAKGKADQIFTCSQSVKQDLLKKGAKDDQLKVIPPGVSEQLFRAKTEESSFAMLKSQQITVGIIGRIDPWKGQGQFIKAAELVLKSQSVSKSLMLGASNKISYQFLVIGESSSYDLKTEQFAQELEDDIKRKNLEERIKFMGFLPIEEALARLDILVHASIAPEPFGRVIIEAMAAGVPVVASKLGGGSEIIKQGEDGILIDPEDTEDLASAINLLASDQGLREKIAQQARVKVREKYLLKDVISKLLSSLDQL